MKDRKESKKNLVVVESPTKARTINKILGKGFSVISSMGHIVDLPQKKLGIDIDNGFEPEYRVMKGKVKTLREISRQAKSAGAIYLATDPDREGEAISWHIKNSLEKKKDIKDKKFLRVIFHEITKEAIREAFNNPQDINYHKVSAQQARRVLDRLVGYLLSPFLWKKVSRGLSAGRVQSVALKFIVQREEAIKAFRPQKYYYLNVVFVKDGIEFKGRIVKYKGKNVEFRDKEKAVAVKEVLEGKKFVVNSFVKKIVRRRPQPPFITSTLQQEAFSRFRLPASRTMFIAQRLYEGIDMPQGEALGLITYMRTDSFFVSESARRKVKEFIRNEWGEKFLAAGEYKFKTKGQVQAAHECIRPTHLDIYPEETRKFLDKETAGIYEIIWRRFIASFMRELEIETQQAKLHGGDYEIVARGSKAIFSGFQRVWPIEIKEVLLPSLRESETIAAKRIDIEEHTTKPPARFNDASLVKLLEEKGIGRPSTYASTIATLVKRNYIIREKGSFVPTELGKIVVKLLEKFFPDVLDENFTAHLEEELDRVEAGDVDWRKVIEEFYPGFKEEIEKAGREVKKEFISTGEKCPQCGRPLVIRWSRKGRFVSCSGYPHCKYARPLTTGVRCPQEGCGGELVERRNRRGQVFYGCSNFPKCRYTTTKLPEPENA